MIRGKEKFWAALLGGGMATAATVLSLWAMSATGAFDAPGPDEIKAAVVGVVSAIFSAALAYLATNSVVDGPTDQDVADRMESAESLERQWRADLVALQAEREALAEETIPPPPPPKPAMRPRPPAAERTDEP